MREARDSALAHRSYSSEDRSSLDSIMATAATSAAPASAPPPHPPSSAPPTLGRPTINTSSARRSPLASILASSLGHGSSRPNSPSSPSAHSPRHARYPSLSSNPPLSASSTATIDSFKHFPARKSSLMGDGTGAGGAAGAPASPKSSSVYIHIDRSSTSSLPQILLPKKRVAQHVVSNLSYIAAWYFFSTALSIYNKVSCTCPRRGLLAWYGEGGMTCRKNREQKRECV
ncbi:hypothetical protein B0O80DRAFT_154003 [Mortierella sp. GBAus27b]|nr:hypothetical protein B0O80DRAFT_154003 [Mortierella sp. GBAus27b]